MTRKLHFFLAVLALALCAGARAADDVTSTYLTNSGFESCTATTSSLTTSSGAGGITDYASEGWTVSNASATWCYGTVMAYGSNIYLNNETYGIVPSTAWDESDDNKNALCVALAWQTTLYYSSASVTLPAGTYTLEYHCYNSSTAGTDWQANYTGFVTSDGTTYYSEKTSFTSSVWETGSVTFTLSEETSGTFQVGGYGQNAGSGLIAYVWFDDLTLSYSSVEGSYAELLEQAEELVSSEYLHSSIAESLQTYIDGSDPDDYETAIEELTAVIEEAEASIELNTALWEDSESIDCTSSIDEWATTTTTSTLAYNTWSSETDSYVTVPFVQNWGTSTMEAGSTTYYTQTGVLAGEYKITGTIRFFQESANMTELAGATFFYNDEEEDLSTSAISGSCNSYTAYYAFINDTVTVGEDGVLTFGLEVGDDVNYTWVAFKDFALAKAWSDDELLEQAAELVSNAYLNSSIAESLQAYIDDTTGVDTEALSDAIDEARASIELNTTLWADGEACTDPADSNSGWTSANRGSNSYNTWSTDVDYDAELDVYCPYVENWVWATSADATVGNGTFYYEATGLLEGAYTITGKIRVYSEYGNTPLTGAVFFATGADDVDLISDDNYVTSTYNSSFVLIYKAIEITANVGSDGVLQFGLNTDNSNYNWVNYKDFQFAAAVADKDSLEAAIAASEAAYEAAGIGDGIFLISTEDGDTYAAAIAAAQAVDDDVTCTQEEVDAAITTLLAADEVFAAAEVNLPVDGQLYTLVNKGSGYYLGIDEEPEVAGKNDIIFSSTTTAWYIIYDEEAGTAQLLNEDSTSYVCHYGGDTWTMGTTYDSSSSYYPGIHSFTIAATSVDDAVYYQLQSNIISGRVVGTTETSEGAILYDDKYYSSIGDLGLWTISEYVEEEDPLGKAELLKAIDASTSTYEAASIGDALFQTPEADAATYTEAIATAQAVYDSEDESQTADDVTAAIEALAEADAVFAAAINTPDEGHIYRFVNKQTGYYLAVNDDATSTSGNIVMSSTDAESWYISYDSSTGYSQLYNDNSDYICYVGTNTWTMGTEGTVLDLGIIPTEVDGSIYYQLELYLNSRTRIIGTYSDEDDPAVLYCDKIYSSIGDWGLWCIEDDAYEFICTDWVTGDASRVSQDDISYDEEANTITVNATGDNNVALQLDYSNCYYTVGEELVYLLVEGTGLSTEEGASYLWWLNGINQGSSVAPDTIYTTDDGVVGMAWLLSNTGLDANCEGDDWSICQGATIFGLTSTDGTAVISYIGFVSEIGSEESEDTDDEEDTEDTEDTEDGDDTAETLNGYTVVGTEVVEVELTEGTYYQGETATFDLATMLAALGTDDVANCTQWIMNATDSSFVTNTTDGWRNADGDMETWGSSSMVCVKINDASSGTIDYIGTIDTSYEAGDEYDAYWAFTYGESVYIIDVHITFVAAEVVSADDYTIVGSTEVSVSAEPDDSYTTTSADIDEDAIVAALGCESIDDATFAAVVDGEVITVYTANYGYYFDSSEDVCSWGDDGCAFFVEFYGSGYSYLAFGQYPDGMAEGDSYSVTLYFIYGENAYSVTATYSVVATGISSVSTDGTFEATSIYSLSGQLIRTQATSLEGLPQGIYIVGGQKVLVK